MYTIFENQKQISQNNPLYRKQPASVFHVVKTEENLLNFP